MAAIALAGLFGGLYGRTPQPSVFKKTKIVIGITPEYRPLHFIEEGPNGDPSGDKRAGLEIDMSASLCPFLNVECSFREMPLGSLTQSLAAGEIDLILSGMSINLERGAQIWFSEPYLTITPALLVHKNKVPQTSFGEEFETRPIRTIWDLAKVSNVVVAVKEGSSYQPMVAESFPGWKVVAVKTNEEGFELMKSGKVDGFIHDSLFLEYYLKENMSSLRGVVLLSGGNRIEEIAIGIEFGAVEVKNQVDLWIREVKRTGEFDEWMEKYMGSQRAILSGGKR